VPRGIIEDVLVQVDKFIYSVDFVVLDTQPVEVCNLIPVILKRLFLATSNAKLINCRNGVMKFSFGNMTLEMNIFNICKPTMFKDSHAFCKTCENCQKLGYISKHHMMPLNLILVIGIFDYWGIDFMGPFPPSFGFLYILVVIDYVSKWIEAIQVEIMITNSDKVFEKKYFESIWNPSSHDK
jgi:hypothetical protein